MDDIDARLRVMEEEHGPYSQEVERDFVTDYHIIKIVFRDGLTLNGRGPTKESALRAALDEAGEPREE